MTSQDTITKKNIFILYIKGARPKTLLASVLPVAASYTLAHFHFSSELNSHAFLLLIFAILSAMAIQIATNLFNDAIDFEKGADRHRVGPKRITNDTTMPPVLVKRMANFTLIAAALFGIPLIIQGGWPIFFMGVLSLYLSYGYTGGPFPLAYLGLGELFVFLFFGLFVS